MILLDTNIVSALMTEEADVRVVAWLDSQRPDDLATTAITVFEIQFGLSLMLPSRRRSLLAQAFTDVLTEDLKGRILAFDETAARAAGDLAARRQAQGRRVEAHDTDIAGIAIAHRAAICTRNVRHFEDAGVTLHDPWA